MLNLSEDGCAFEAISPVKLGKTGFAFQISGGRRIAGDAEVRWVDEPGITGGLQFLHLQAEVREQIHRWLNDTRAPQEPEIPPSHTRRPTVASPTLEDAWARFPLLREGLSGGASRARSASLARRIAVLAMVVAGGALVHGHQREVANRLTLLGEILKRGPTAPAVVPELKSPVPENPRLEVNGTPEEAEAQAAPNKELDPTKTEVSPSEEPDPAKPNALTGNAERTESPQGQQAIRPNPGESPPSARVPIRRAHPARSESRSEASLWEGVQGGSVSAELTLAERFMWGHGVPKNCDQARVLLTAAVSKGNREARLRLYRLQSGGCQ